jgi:hypothetical protein
MAVVSRRVKRLQTRGRRLLYIYISQTRKVVHEACYVCMQCRGELGCSICGKRLKLAMGSSCVVALLHTDRLTETAISTQD